MTINADQQVEEGAPDAQAVTYLHSPCKCGEPIDCTGDEINMFGALTCGHFNCEPCELAIFKENNWNGYPEHYMTRLIRDGYHKPCEDVERRDRYSTTRMHPDARDDKGELEYLDGTRIDPFTGGHYETPAQLRGWEEEERRRTHPDL